MGGRERERDRQKGKRERVGGKERGESARAKAWKHESILVSVGAA
jgi:hypothetical protein